MLGKGKAHLKASAERADEIRAAKEIIEARVRLAQIGVRAARRPLKDKRAP